MTKEEILNFLKENKDRFKKEYDVERIGLFGSFAKDLAKESSDIDIYVEMKADFFKLSNLKSSIEENLHHKVDLVRKHKNIKPLLLEEIKKDIIYV
jgi:predicted nucleotidyltransferase